MPRCTCATSSDDIFRIMRERAFDQIGPSLPRGLPEQPRNHAFEKRFRAALEDFAATCRRPARAPAESAGAFVLQETERSHASAMPPPEFEQGVSANGNAGQRSAADLGIVHYARDIAGVLLHRGRPFAHSGISVPPQIGKNYAVMRGQRLSHRQPKFMIGGKRMQQDDRRALAQHAVGNLRVAALYSLKGYRSMTGRLRVNDPPCETTDSSPAAAPTGAVSSSRLFRHHDPGDGVGD